MSETAAQVGKRIADAAELDCAPALQAVAHSSLAAFVAGLIGKPYQVGAAGPDVFDCSGLVSYVLREQFGIAFPHFAAPDDPRGLVKFIQNNPEQAQWRTVPRPVHGGLVVMSHATAPHHVGLWLDLDGGRILHASEATRGVAFESIFRMKLTGWRSLTFGEHV